MDPKLLTFAALLAGVIKTAPSFLTQWTCVAVLETNLPNPDVILTEATLNSPFSPVSLIPKVWSRQNVRHWSQSLVSRLRWPWGVGGRTGCVWLHIVSRDADFIAKAIRGWRPFVSEDRSVIIVPIVKDTRLSLSRDSIG